MQLTREVRMGHVKDPARVTNQQFTISFVRKRDAAREEKARRPETMEEATRRSQSAWFAVVGWDPRKQQPTQGE